MAPAIAHGQMSGPPANVPKPTKADTQKVVQSINSDKAKLLAYCDIVKLSQQMAAADEKKDIKTLQDLSPKFGALANKLGPDYIKLMDGLDKWRVDENSPEGKEIAAPFDSLDKQCK